MSMLMALMALMAKAPAAPKGIIEIIFSGGIVGITIVLVLFALSLGMVYLVVEQWLTLRRKELLPEEVAKAVGERIRRRRIDEAIRVCQERPSFLSSILASGLSEIEGGWPEVEKALEESLAEQAARLMRRIEYLSVIGNIAPMVGLLGTVTGMILAFQQVATSGGAAGAPELAEGIYQALVTTVGGLIVAIPSLAAFAVFRNRLDQFTAEAAYQIQHIFLPLKRRRRAPAAAPGPGSPPAPPRPRGG